MDIQQAVDRLEPGQSITFGRAWDGAFYVKHTQTTVGQFLGEVKNTIAYGKTPAHAWQAEQKEVR